MSRTQGNTWNRLRQTAGTAVVAYVFLIIVAEALHATQHHAGSFIANGAVCGFQNGAGCALDAVNGFQCCALAQHVIHQVGKLAESDAARGAFAAGLCVAQL